MSTADQIYLTAAIAAFVFFGTTLFSVYIWSGLGPKTDRPSRKPVGLVVVALGISIVSAAVIAQAVRNAGAAAEADPPQLTAAR